MANILGFESYRPENDVAYRENIVSGIQSMGAEVQKQLRAITEKKQLTALGSELEGIDPASPDFAHRMASTITKYPVAASSAPGVAAINMLGKSHLQILENQQFQLRQTAMGNGPYIPPVGSGSGGGSGSRPTRTSENTLVTSELPQAGPNINGLGDGMGNRTNIPTPSEISPDDIQGPVDEDAPLIPNEGAGPESTTQFQQRGGRQAATAAPLEPTQEEFIDTYAEKAVAAEFKRNPNLTERGATYIKERAMSRGERIWADNHPKGAQAALVKLNPKTGKLEAADGTVMKLSKVGPGGASFVVAEGSDGKAFAQPLEQAVATREEMRKKGITVKIEPNSKGEGYVVREVPKDEQAQLIREATATQANLAKQEVLLKATEDTAEGEIKDVIKAEAPWRESTGAQAKDPNLPVSKDNPLVFKFDNGKKSIPATQADIKRWERYQENNRTLDEVKRKRANISSAIKAIGDVVEKGANSPAWQAARLREDEKEAAKVSQSAKPGAGKNISLSKITELGKTKEEAIALGYTVIE